MIVAGAVCRVKNPVSADFVTRCPGQPGTYVERMRTDDPMLALQRDTRNRQVILWSVVIGILASVIAFPFLAGTFHPAAMRDTGLMGVLLLPFAICYGLGQLVYRLLRRVRG